MPINNKLLLINNGYPSPQNPQYCTYIKTIHECLVKAGCDVQLLIIQYNSLKNWEKIKKYILFFKDLFRISFSLYDIIYINHAPFAFPAFIRPSLYRKKVFIHWHGDELISKKFSIRLIRKYIKFCSQNMKHIVPSLYFKSKLIEIMNIKEENIIVSPSGGVNISLFRPKLKIKNTDPFIIGFASALTFSKGADMLLKLVRNSKIIEHKIYRPVAFRVIRYGQDADSFIERIKNENFPVYIHEKMSKDDMPDYYNMMMMMVMMTTREGESLGLVTLEALSCGVPVVAFNMFAFPEFIIPSKSGLLIQKSDDKSKNVINFINAITEVYFNLSNYNPREVVFEKYTNQYVVEQYKQYLFELKT
jgi:glycosyltransferase involved in cell wall biosynthesis